MKREGFLLKLGLRGYKEVLDLQTRMNTARKQNAIPDTVIFLEHHPCITIGAHGNNDSILASRRLLKEKGIEVYEHGSGWKRDLSWSRPDCMLSDFGLKKITVAM